jgi:hypothetical protein
MANALSRYVRRPVVLVSKTPRGAVRQADGSIQRWVADEAGAAPVTGWRVMPSAKVAALDPATTRGRADMVG